MSCSQPVTYTRILHSHRTQLEARTPVALHILQTHTLRVRAAQTRQKVPSRNERDFIQSQKASSTRASQSVSQSIGQFSGTCFTCT